MDNEEFAITYDSLKSVLIVDSLGGTFLEGLEDSTFRGVVALNSPKSAFFSTDTIGSTLTQAFQMEALTLIGGGTLMPKQSILDPDTGCLSVFLQKMVEMVKDSFDIELESKYSQLLNGKSRQDASSARGIYIYVIFDSTGHANPNDISIISQGNAETHLDLNQYIYAAIYLGIKNRLIYNCESNSPIVRMIPLTLPSSDIQESENVRKRAIHRAFEKF